VCSHSVPCWGKKKEEGSALQTLSANKEGLKRWAGEKHSYGNPLSRKERRGGREKRDPSSWLQDRKSGVKSKEKRYCNGLRRPLVEEKKGKKDTRPIHRSIWGGMHGKKRKAKVYGSV